MRKRLLIMAWIHLIIGGVGLGLLAALLAAVALARDPEYNDEFALFGSILGGFSLVYFLPMYMGGLGLLQGKRWARGLLWCQSALLALAVPVGTVLAGFNLWALHTTSTFPAMAALPTLSAWCAGRCMRWCSC